MQFPGVLAKRVGRFKPPGIFGSAPPIPQIRPKGIINPKETGMVPTGMNKRAIDQIRKTNRDRKGLVGLNESMLPYLAGAAVVPRFAQRTLHNMGQKTIHGLIKIGSNDTGPSAFNVKSVLVNKGKGRLQKTIAAKKAKIASIGAIGTVGVAAPTGASMVERDNAKRRPYATPIGLR